MRHEEFMKKRAGERHYEKPPPPDTIKQPEHYAQHRLQPVDFIMSNGLSFWAGNVIKYVSRAGTKLYPNQDSVQSEINDIRKAIRYCEMRINQLEGRNPSHE